MKEFLLGINRIIHEPARLTILTILAGSEWSDFASLYKMLGISRGNLSVHSTRLQEAGYVKVKKTIVEKIPHTTYRITKKGRDALVQYWRCMDAIRGFTGSQ